MTKRGKKYPKYIIVPSCIAVYFLIMAYIGRDELLVEKDYFSYFGKIVVEVVVLIALYFVLKKRDKLRKERESKSQ